MADDGLAEAVKGHVGSLARTVDAEVAQRDRRQAKSVVVERAETLRR